MDAGTLLDVHDVRQECAGREAHDVPTDIRGICPAGVTTIVLPVAASTRHLPVPSHPIPSPVIERFLKRGRLSGDALLRDASLAVGVSSADLATRSSSHASASRTVEVSRVPLRTLSGMFARQILGSSAAAPGCPHARANQHSEHCAPLGLPHQRQMRPSRRGLASSVFAATIASA